MNPNGICEVCHRYGEVVTTIYASTGVKATRCPECLNQPEDFSGKKEPDTEAGNDYESEGGIS